MCECPRVEPVHQASTIVQALPCCVDQFPRSTSLLQCRKHSEQAFELQVCLYLGALALETVAVPIHSRTLGREGTHDHQHLLIKAFRLDIHLLVCKGHHADL